MLSSPSVMDAMVQPFDDAFYHDLLLCMTNTAVHVAADCRCCLLMNLNLGHR